MTGLDPSLVGYEPPGGGGWVTLSKKKGPTTPTVPAQRGPDPKLTLKGAVDGQVATVTVTADQAYADLAAATWTITPAPQSYGGEKLRGRQGVYKQTGQSATATVSVPRTDGGPPVTATIVTESASTYVGSLFPRAYTWGEAVKIEAGFKLPYAATKTVQLVRTASSGNPSENLVIEERQVAFPADTAVSLSRTEAFTRPAGKGTGFEYEWRVFTSPSSYATAGPLPVWVYGTGVTRQARTAAPDTINYPPIYTRRASDSGTVVPAAGRTYAQYMDAFLAGWKALNLSVGSQPGGAWLSIDDYNANLVWVNLDDTTIPRYDVRWWDVWEGGWPPAGWTGDDWWAKPYARSKVAVDVPIPDHATPSPGNDRSMAIVGMRGGQIEKIWEFWLMEKHPDSGWRAASGGYTTAAENWQHSARYTTAASGISAVAYSLKVKEAKAAVDYIRAERAAGRTPSEDEIIKRIPHCIGINMPYTRQGKVSYPATFTDGASTDDAIPWEGQNIRIRGDAPIATQGLTPLKHAIAVVGKHRGFVVTDKTAWSTTMIVEGDQSYGGGIWTSEILDPGESYAVKFPDDWFILGKQYPDKASFDADTSTNLLTMNAVEDAPGEVLVTWSPVQTVTVSRDGADRDGTIGWNATDSSGSYRFGKLLPGNTYKFTVAAGGTSVSKTLTLVQQTTPTPLGQAGAWTLAWSDEFNGTSLDKSVWNDLRGMPGGSYDTPYAQDADLHGYHPSRVTVGGGNLRLAWDPTKITTMWGRQYDYTAGMVHSGPGFKFKYGYLEARIFFTKSTAGLWPAFWLLSTPVDQDWPPEIDLAEWVCHDTPDGLYHPHFNIHYGPPPPDNKQINWQSYGPSGVDYSGGWHTYGFLWRPGFAQMFLDGQPGPSYTGTEALPDRDMYVILSTGIAKDRGIPSAQSGEMLIDYVRHWTEGSTTPSTPTSMPLSDARFQQFTATNGATSTYHLWGNGRTTGAPLMVWLHGDAAYEHAHPDDWYVFGGANGVAEVCRQRGIVLASALTPDTTGTQTWWEDGDRNAAYLEGLIAKLRADVQPSTVYLAGYSGGAQFITQYYLPQKSATLPQGGSIVFGGGGKPVSPATPTISATFKTDWWMNWTTGALDDAAHSGEGYDALWYAQQGEAWYRGAGFRTFTNWVPDTTHVMDERFGGFVAQALDAAANPVATPYPGDVSPDTGAYPA